jgi:hypothetical protein
MDYLEDMPGQKSAVQEETTAGTSLGNNHDFHSFVEVLDGISINSRDLDLRDLDSMDSACK